MQVVDCPFAWSEVAHGSWCSGLGGGAAAVSARAHAAAPGAGKPGSASVRSWRAPFMTFSARSCPRGEPRKLPLEPRHWATKCVLASAHSCATSSSSPVPEPHPEPEPGFQDTCRVGQNRPLSCTYVGRLTSII